MNPYDRTLRQPAPVIPGQAKKARPDTGSGSLGTKIRRYRAKANPRGSRECWVVSDDARNALERCELFSDISKPQMMEVAALVEEVSLESDEMMLTEGEPASHIFVIIEGRGVAQLSLDRGWISLGLVGPSDVAGWAALVGGQAYPASVRALTPMRVVSIETQGLTLLLNLESGIGYPVHRRLNSIFFRQYQAALDTLKTTV